MAEECIFCTISRGATNTEFVYESPRIVAFRDIHPQAPVHLLIVPTVHIPTINDLSSENAALIGETVLVARDLAATFNVAKSGYKLIFNVERGGGQLVFHLHLHLLGGWT